MSDQHGRHLTQVRDWMTPNPVTIAPDARLIEAYNLMQEHEIRRLPVVTLRNELVGILTLSDLLQHIPSFPDDPEIELDLPLMERTVQEIMTWHPLTIDGEATIQEAADLMLEGQVSGLPVREGPRLVGILTESDIFRLVVEAWGREG